MSDPPVIAAGPLQHPANWLSFYRAVWFACGSEFRTGKAGWGCVVCHRFVVKHWSQLVSMTRFGAPTKHTTRLYDTLWTDLRIHPPDLLLAARVIAQSSI